MEERLGETSEPRDRSRSSVFDQLMENWAKIQKDVLHAFRQPEFPSPKDIYEMSFTPPENEAEHQFLAPIGVVEIGELPPNLSPLKPTA